MYRFAPSLRGDMHIGNLRVALFNYILAKQNGEQFIVRMEDSDKTKNIEGKDQEILDILAIFGISYDALYYQSENIKYHLQFASFLLDKQKAFSCFCTQKVLEKKRAKAVKNAKPYSYDGTCMNISSEEVLNNPNPFTIRIKKPEKSLSFIDSIQGEMSFSPKEIDSFIIMEKEKYPTYNFACACDDMIQGIKRVIRDEEHILNTPRQEYIRDSLGYHEKIEYAHLPSLVDTKGKKLSKKQKSYQVKALLDQGIMPEAIVNYLLTLGNETPKKIFTMQEAISWLDIKKLSKESADFNMEKLKLVNQEHIKQIDDMELSKRIGYSCAKLAQAAKLYAKEFSTTLEIKQKIDALFIKKEEESIKDSLEKLKAVAKDAPYFEEFSEFEAYMKDKSRLKEEEFSQALRFLLTGAHSGPNLSELYPLIKNYLQEIVK